MTVDRLHLGRDVLEVEGRSLRLFQGRRRRRKLGGVDLLVVEAAAQRQGCGDDGKSNDGAHDYSLYLVLNSTLGTRN